MKYGILTHPIIGNYGGMIQAYAMSHSLFILGYKSPISVYKNDRANCLKRLLFDFFKIAIVYIRRLPYNSTLPECCFFHTGQAFSKQYLNQSVNKAQYYRLSGWVVGSDQVWRGEYARALASLPFFFLNFATFNQRQNSISYAASFGSDEWEGSEEETIECASLLRDFKAVSVREHSGVKICKDVFGVDAVQMPDPTLLLRTEDYNKIIDSEKTWLPQSKYVSAYVLDETKGKAELLLESVTSLNVQLQHLMPHATAKKRRDRFPISVPQWLRLIRDCEYFITDSFHGCVFAIIYNKPFVCLGNEGRGNARFDTLLGTFGLEDRLITDATPEIVTQVLKTPIDWERVNAIHDAERERGISFLKENLTSHD